MFIYFNFSNRKENISFYRKIILPIFILLLISCSENTYENRLKDIKNSSSKPNYSLDDSPAKISEQDPIESKRQRIKELVNPDYSDSWSWDFELNNFTQEWSDDRGELIDFINALYNFRGIVSESTLDSFLTFAREKFPFLDSTSFDQLAIALKREVEGVFDREMDSIIPDLSAGLDQIYEHGKVLVTGNFNPNEAKGYVKIILDRLLKEDKTSGEGAFFICQNYFRKIEPEEYQDIFSQRSLRQRDGNRNKIRKGSGGLRYNLIELYKTLSKLVANGVNRGKLQKAIKLMDFLIGFDYKTEESKIISGESLDSFAILQSLKKERENLVQLELLLDNNS